MKILFNVPFKVDAALRPQFERAAPGVAVVEQFVPKPDDLNGDGVAVLVTEQVPRDLSRWKDLKWVQLISAGSNQLLGHPIRDTDIAITNASGTHGVPIAQYITCATLMAAHRMPELLNYKPSRQWPNRGALAGMTLRGRTVGIAGYGSIGRECARQLSALGMRVLALKNNPASREDHGYNAWPETGDPLGKIPAEWYGPAQLADMLPQCDFVIVTLPSTPKTENMFSAREFALMKPTAHLILISRGGIVDETALSAALREKRIAGATLDCFLREPTPSDYPLFDVPNLVMTPHMSGVYEGFWPLFQNLVAENLRRFAAGQPLLNRVSHGQGY